MRETLKNEAKRYVKLSNEDWGKVSGLLLGTAAGIYAVVRYTSTFDISDPVIKIALNATIIPLTAGLAAHALASAGAAIDVVANRNTILNWAFYKTSQILEERDVQARAKQFFFRHPESASDGETYDPSLSGQRKSGYSTSHEAQDDEQHLSQGSGDVSEGTKTLLSSTRANLPMGYQGAHLPQIDEVERQQLNL